MKHYVHHIPGRLRVTTPWIKRNPTSVERVEGLLTAIRGIDSVVINPVTGSILVEYATDQVGSSQILNLLKKEGYLDLDRAFTNDQYIQAKFSKTARIFSSAISGAFLELALQGTGLSFLALLI